MEQTKELLTALAQEAQGTSTILALTVNEWDMEGTLAGTVAYDRGWSPLGDEYTFATHRWYATPNGNVALESGHYDLTKQQALRDFAQRTGIANLVTT